MPARRRAFLAVFGAYVGSRLLLLLLGLRMNTEALTWYWQVLDPALLTSRLGESLYFLHCQPPLFNLLLGLVLKVAPAAPAGIFHGVFFAAGLGLAVVLFELLVELGAGRRTAALLVVVTSLSPSWVVYESWLFYDFLVAVGLSVAMLALLKAGRTRSIGWFLVFFASVGALSLTRSLHHPIWLAAVVAVGLGCRVAPRRTRCVVAIVPLLLVLGLCAKNMALFGFFGQSSWLGMSLSKMTVTRLEPVERRRLIESGQLSPFADVVPFSPVNVYEAAAGSVMASDDDPPALGRRSKSTGHPNFNHRAYVGISATLLQDALTVIRHEPGLYAQAVAIAVQRFFSSTVAYPPFAENLTVVFPLFRLGEATWNRPVVAVLTYGAAILACLLGWWRSRRLGDTGLAAASVFVLFNLLWVLVVGCLVEVGENHRFRATLLPLVWTVLLGAGFGFNRAESRDTSDST